MAKEYLAQKRERLEKKIKQHLQSELQRANLNAAANSDLSDIVSSLSGKELLYFRDHPNKQVMRIKGNIIIHLIEVTHKCLLPLCRQDTLSSTRRYLLKKVNRLLLHLTSKRNIIINSHCFYLIF